MNIKILPYKLGSKTAKALASGLGAVRIHHQPKKSKYRGRTGDVIYNYGNGAKGFVWLKDSGVLLLNHPSAINRASSKTKAFEGVAGYLKGNKAVWKLPRFTTSKEEARGWINDGSVVYCRTLTRASEGRGIVVAHNVGELVSAPLYVEGITNIKREYRVHVFAGEVIDLVAKATESGKDDADMEIRNHNNGWVFVRDSVKVPDEVRKQLGKCAIETCKALGIDVAAVDIIRDTNNNVFMLEVNTAPGMEGTTLQKYSEALRKFCNKPTKLESQSAGGFYA